MREDVSFSNIIHAMHEIELVSSQQMSAETYWRLISELYYNYNEVHYRLQVAWWR